MNAFLMVDLDGTLIKGNSFHMLVRVLLQVTPFNIRLRVLYACILRATGMFSHKHFNYEIQSIVAAVPPDCREMIVSRVIDKMELSLNGDVVNVVEVCRKLGYVDILATAASEVYSKEFARRHGFKACLASSVPSDLGAWHENRGVAKRDACMELIDREGGSDCRVIAVSDHSDDLPLLALSDLAVWCGPVETMAEVRAHLPKVEIVHIGAWERSQQKASRLISSPERLH